MRLSDFDYILPRELIAQHPLRERDACRLMVVNRSAETIEHRTFRDILSYITRDYLIVLNNTKVLPCRLKGRRSTGGKVELLLVKRKAGLTFDAYVKPGRIKLGEKILFDGNGLSASLSARNEVTFSAGDINDIYKTGVMPLPPYIKREPEEEDALYYQTVYAAREGAVAAPTAGLHFTENMIKEMISRGSDIAYLTLHVGPGTFKPVDSEDITRHKMEVEYFEVSQEAGDAIDDARSKNKRICAVGTTSLRALEAYAAGTREGFTDLFIYPGYKFKIAQALLTNFHLPRTTLFMLVCAFCAADASGGTGYELMKKAYQEAIAEKYRFYSYGDAMLII
ncbi:MAG: tRNA preQ1(34) S-adenosylmethionine ribosyltransferase-isomerase QueA [Candidatus Omnitrophica bacterium]|nr:tRNA preQ1(34) S-adenosylmethionine ribosyltransferase-isomerase QueA [Candidatus Omnitrophota bacterium]